MNDPIPSRPGIRPRHRATVRLACAIAASACALPAAAHHPVGGATPDSLVHGLLSGLGHPVIGPDHLAFLVTVALLAAFHRPLALRGASTLAVLFAAAGTVGVVLRTAAPAFAGIEVLAAATVLAAGVALAFGRVPAALPGAVAAAVAGSIHGYAFGEAIVGAEATPLIAYLVGLAAAQGALLTVAFVAGRRLGVDAPGRIRAASRTAGLAATTIGLVLVARATATVVAG
jgi:urease accessory protein